MTSLATFLGTDLIAVDDETLILLRLLGRPFGRPINLDLGEDPDDVLRSFLRTLADTNPLAPRATVPFVELIAKLLTLPVTADAPVRPLDALLAGLEEPERASLAFRLVRLIEDSAVPVDETSLRAVAGKLAPTPYLAGPSLSALWQLLLSRFSQSIIPDDEIAVCRKTVLEPAFIDGPIIAAARARPYLFLGTIVPIVFEALRERSPLAVHLPSLGPAMRAGFAALYREPGDRFRRQTYLRLFAGQLEELAASVTASAKTAAAAATAALDGAAQATAWFATGRSRSMPFAEFALLEAGFSRGQARAGQLSPIAKDRLDQLLERYVRQIRKTIEESMGDAVDPALSTNFVPYAEGVYLRMWQALLQRAGMKIEMKEHDWGNVVPSLLSGKLSFAIWNDYVPDDFSSDNRIVYRTSEPLLQYNGYPLVLRRDILDDIANDLPASEAKMLIAALTRGRPISDEAFNSCEALKVTLRRMRLALVDNTDIQEVAHRALGMLDNARPMPSDDAVEGLIDGRLDGAFLGGVQAAYLAQRFDHAVVTLTESSRPTPMHLWFNGVTFGQRQYPQIVLPLLNAWRQTCHLWKDAQGPRAADNSGDHLRLREWILTLASELNNGVNGSELSMRTPISSWRMLSGLSKKHNVLLAPAGVRPHKHSKDIKSVTDPTRGKVINFTLNKA